jgi:hypothetical protein
VGGVELLAVLRAANPDAPMWSCGPDQHSALLTTADAARDHGPPRRRRAGARGRAGDLARSGGRRRERALRQPADRRLWTVRLAADGYTWDTAAVPSPTCEVAGTASDLLLGVYGRIPIGAARYDVTGDRAVLERWIEKSAI